MKLVASVTEAAFPTALDALTFRFEDLPRQLRRIVDEALDGHDLGRTQWRLLAYVLRKAGMTQTELARCLEVERASVGQAIDALEGKGFLARRQKDGDRRVWCIVATDKARGLLADLRVVMDEVYEQMFAGFSSADIALLEDFLDRIANNIRA